MDRTDSGLLVLCVAAALFVSGMAIAFARELGWVRWPARATRAAGLGVVAATACAVLLLPDATGPRAFFRDLEGLDIYGDQQTVMLQRGQRYCTLDAPVDNRTRQHVFDPSASVPTGFWAEPLARWSVRRLCPDRRDLLPADKGD